MLEPWTATGEWWLPNVPEKRWSGTLNWEPEGGARLELAGVVETSGHTSKDRGPGPAIVLGQSHVGKIYTCLHTFFAGNSSGFHGKIKYDISRLDVDTIFSDIHFNDLQEIRFDRVRLRYSNLHEWYWGGSAITMKEILSTDGMYDGKEWQITHARRKLWEVATPEGYQVENSYNFSYEDTEAPTPQIIFTHTDGILITANGSAGMREVFYALERSFRELIHLLAEFPLQLTAVEAARERDGQTGIMIYNRALLSHLPTRKRPHLFAPILFSQLGPRRFEVIFRAWLDVREKLRMIANLYLSDRLGNRLELSGAFLRIMQALEAYHHIFYPNHVYMEREEYRRTVAAALVKAIPANVTRPLRDKLKSMVGYGYEYSLFKKLEELTGELPSGELRNEVLSGDFLRQSVNTRNYLVHRDPEAQSNSLEGAELYRAVRAWQEVLFAMLLGRIGLSPDEINRGSATQRQRRGRYFTMAEPI